MAKVDLNVLWGGTLEQVDIDVVYQKVAFTIQVKYRGVVNRYRLYLRNVTEFRFANEIPGPWDYAEVTEAHVTELPSAALTIEFVLWSEEAGLWVTCGAASLCEVPLNSP